MHIKLFADSTCDLPVELREKYQIGIVPMTITLGGISYRDGLDLNSEDIFAAVSGGEALPITSAGNVDEYISAFAPWVEQGYELIHISLSSAISSTCRNALLAAGELGHVTVVDSLNLCGAQGLLVLKCAELIAEGKTLEEIVPLLTAYRDKLESGFVIENLEYMRKGGRCSAIELLGANALKLKPCIHVCDGKLTPYKKYRGNMSRILGQYVKDCLGNLETVDTSRFIFGAAGYEDKLILALRQELLRLCPDAGELIEIKAGCSISTHCGPGCVGLFFARK